MPKTIPLVSELEWKAVSNGCVTNGNASWYRSYVNSLGTEFVVMAGSCPAWFTESCRQKLLAAMDNFGKVEEPEHWKQLSSIANDLSSPHAKALLELRQRIESLEGKK